MPFSDGHHTVELALDGILEQQNDDAQEANRWEEARKRAEHQLSAGIEFKISLRPVGTVPLNFVKRGDESFAGI